MNTAVLLVIGHSLRFSLVAYSMNAQSSQVVAHWKGGFSGFSINQLLKGRNYGLEKYFKNFFFCLIVFYFILWTKNLRRVHLSMIVVLPSYWFLVVKWSSKCYFVFACCLLQELAFSLFMWTCTVNLKWLTKNSHGTSVNPGNRQKSQVDTLRVLKKNLVWTMPVVGTLGPLPPEKLISDLLCELMGPHLVTLTLWSA